jgi:hypothetical protein
MSDRGHKRALDHIDGLPRTRPVYLSKRTRAGPAGVGSVMGQ